MSGTECINSVPDTFYPTAPRAGNQRSPSFMSPDNLGRSATHLSFVARPDQPILSLMPRRLHAASGSPSRSARSSRDRYACPILSLRAALWALAAFRSIRLILPRTPGLLRCQGWAWRICGTVSGRTGVERRRDRGWSPDRCGGIPPGLALGEPQVVPSVPIALGMEPGQLPRPAIAADLEDPGPYWLSPR